MSYKKRRRRFVPSACNHVYQRAAGGNILFYDREDYLIFYMIVSVMAKKYGTRVLELCLMVDHIHLLIETDTLEQMAAFVRDYSAVFAREYNDSIGRHGKVLWKSYGSAPKKGSKQMRSAIVYIGNNPVEKMLCDYAEDYRWNFLKYIKYRAPFSDGIMVRDYSRPLARAVKIVNSAVRACRFLNYSRLYHLFADLNDMDKERLTDYIVNAYSPFDVDGLMEYYDDYEQMIAAMHSTAGSEHDIKEEWMSRSDRIYGEMVSCLKKEQRFVRVRSAIAMPMSRKVQLAEILRRETGATLYEIARFLHMKHK